MALCRTHTYVKAAVVAALLTFNECWVMQMQPVLVQWRFSVAVLLYIEPG